MAFLRLPLVTLTLFAALALLLAACAEEPAGDDPPATTPPAETPGGDGGVPDPEPTSGDGADDTGWQTCENPVGGYEVSYPPDWETNEDDELMDDCRVFDTPPLELPDQPQDLSLDYGVTIAVDNVPFDVATGEDIGATVESSEETEVDGLPAVRQETVGTGEALIPEGVATTTWFVDLGDATLIATSYDVGEPPYEEKVAVLDRMMASMELADGD